MKNHKTDFLKSLYKKSSFSKEKYKETKKDIIDVKDRTTIISIVK